MAEAQVRVATATTAVVDIITPQAKPQEDGYDSSCSVDTEDAFLDMLGLKKEANEALPILVMNEEEVSKEEDTLFKAIPIPLPPKCSRYGHTNCAAVTIDNFSSPAECDSILRLARQRGFQYITEASHVAPDGSAYKVQLQNPNPHKLAVFENKPFTDRLWKRLVHQTNLNKSNWMQHFQKRTHSGPPLGLNPRLRVLQYDAQDDDRFEPHFDATTHLGPQKTSRITVLLYLNPGDGVDFEGGETLFLNSHISTYNATVPQPKPTNHDNATKIPPKLGKLVLFEHDLYHAGAPLTWGTKHVLRTDILFERKKDAVVEIETKEGSNTNRSTDHSQPAAILLVQDLCGRHNWSSTEQAVLEDMGLLQDTLESFLVPGTGLLTELLLDGRIARDKIDKFLTAAKDCVKVNSS